MITGGVMDKKRLDEIMTAALGRGAGIEAVCTLLDEDRVKVLEIEVEAEKKGLMGLGKVFNSGLRAALASDRIYVALTNMEFDWSGGPSLVLKKGEEIVGEEVRDEAEIDRLSQRADVWFMHDRFVIYTSKVSFPHDLLKQICYFDSPSLPVQWCKLENEEITCQSIIYSNPTTSTDIYLKNKYFKGTSEKGLGTILIGVQL